MFIGQVSLACRSRRIGAAAGDELANLGCAPRVAIGLPGLRERIAAQIGRRERKRVQQLDLAVGHDQQHRLRMLEPALHLGDDVPRIDRQRDTRVALELARSRSASTARCHSSSLHAMSSHAAAARPIRIIGPVTNALQPRLAARSYAATISCRLKRLGTNTNCGARPRAASRSIAALRRGEARSGPHALVRRRGRTVHRDLHALNAERRQPVGGGVVDAAAVGLELERDAGAGEQLEDLPAMRTRRAARRRRTRRTECRNATMRRASSSASSRRSSSRHALSGPDSSQQAMQRALQRLVSCQARKRGAP